MTPGWIGTALVMLALVAGLGSELAVDAFGGARRINLLDLSLLGLLAWNLAVYALLAVHALRGPAAGPLRQALGRAWRRLGVERPDMARVAVALHAAAAAFALGAVASMYLRGLALEYRAGWESTFISQEAVHRILSLVLGPASRLTGLPLPDAATLGGLNFGAGGGENAARWIHLYATTVVLVVLLPRALLAAVAAWQARRAPRTAKAVAACVLPYSYRIAPALRPRLAAALEPSLGGAVDVELGEAVPFGAEDALDTLLPASRPPGALVALFPLTATPEAENHGAFVAALRARARSGEPVIVLVDESGFVRRFSGPEAASRLAERRASWTRAMQAQALTPRFVNLEAP